MYHNAMPIHANWMRKKTQPSLLIIRIRSLY